MRRSIYLVALVVVSVCASSAWAGVVRPLDAVVSGVIVRRERLVVERDRHRGDRRAGVPLASGRPAMTAVLSAILLVRVTGRIVGTGGPLRTARRNP